METLTRAETIENSADGRVDVQIGDTVLVLRSDNHVERMRVSAVDADPTQTFDSLDHNQPVTGRTVTVVGNPEMSIGVDGQRQTTVPSKRLPENLFAPEHQELLAGLYAEQYGDQERVARNLADIALYQIPAMHR